MPAKMFCSCLFWFASFQSFLNQKKKMKNGFLENGFLKMDF